MSASKVPQASTHPEVLKRLQSRKVKKLKVKSSMYEKSWWIKVMYINGKSLVCSCGDPEVVEEKSR